MAEGKKTLSEKWTGLKAEFRKIVWPNSTTVGKQSAAVVVISVILAILIAVIDMLLQYGVDFLVNL